MVSLVLLPDGYSVLLLLPAGRAKALSKSWYSASRSHNMPCYFLFNYRVVFFSMRKSKGEVVNIHVTSFPHPPSAMQSNSKAPPEQNVSLTWTKFCANNAFYPNQL